MNKKAESVYEFCLSHSMSRTKFYDLIKHNQGPEIMKIGKKTLITEESAKEWRKTMTEKSKRN